MQHKKPVVFVGMSGGVDSSVAAYLLGKQGYTVVGVFIKVWHPDFLPCEWEQERLSAMRVAAYLNIPFLTCNAERAYEEHVAQYFIDEYRKGRTPNPDVMCNTYVKFGAFFEFARMHGADAIATGHYAHTATLQGRTALLRGVDPLKDQSYFLWNIPTIALERTIFPLGQMQKRDVRALARRVGIPTAHKADSQGICFLGHVDIKEFLGHYVDLMPGNVCTQTGDIIGAHDGALLYTIGQRHGFTVASLYTHETPFYVVAKDIDRNTITVSKEKPSLGTGGTVLTLIESTLPPLISEVVCEVQTRYRQQPTTACIVASAQGVATVVLHEGAESPAIGQSCVCYDGMTVLGGGIIDAIATA